MDFGGRRDRKIHTYQLVKACMVKQRDEDRLQINFNIFNSPYVKRAAAPPSYLSMGDRQSRITSVNPENKLNKTRKQSRYRTEETFKESKSRLDILITSIRHNRSLTRDFDTNRTQKKKERKERKERKEGRRLQSQIDDYTLRKGIVSQLQYRQHPIQKLGERYFQQILRNQPKSVGNQDPFLYCIRTNKEPTKFVKLIKKIHPEIPTRHFLKLQGRKACKTQQNQ